ncbi:MAG TPA: asparagine synthase (glutamine-hydrolyzing) [Vicinamibacterales bacterium]|nr:asparagine synthase (glutamine-hydrolyzing) [Vicinamibacterales bacterium]
MCGIAGIFNYGSSSTDDRAVASRMRDAMTHRGPDAAGLYQSPDRRVVLAHRRLSIVDLTSAGRQPMANEDETVWITFNGEIYNHLEERARLAAKGHTFRSRSDTEVIVHAYEDSGPLCVSRLDGMFAFALWDADRRELLIARDRLGKKPVYYTTSDGRFLFASEIKALLQHPDVARDIDPVALDCFLTFSNTPAPLTMFKNIYKLPAAHLLRCKSDGTVRTERYWSPLDGPAWPEANAAGSVERVRELIERSVSKRLMSDVPIGAFLSGGVDSSTNVALMSRLSSQPLRTFSIGFEGFGAAENFHDLPYARSVARHFGCQHHETIITAEDCRRSVPQLVSQQDEPIGDPACLPMQFVARAAKQGGVTVVLVGEGSDEVFGGYPDMTRLIASHDGKWRRLGRLPRAARQGLYRGARAAGMDVGRADVLRRLAVDEPFYWGLDIVFSDLEKRRLYRPGQATTGSSAAASMVAGYYSDLSRYRPDADFLQQMSYVELSNRLPELLLMRVDKFSMAHSLEARAPFLDHELVSYALSLPQSTKISGGQTKKILKEAVTGLLPAEIIHRAKQGFRVPLSTWLAGPLSKWAEERLFSKAARELDFLDFGYIEHLWERHRTRQADQSFDLWSLINLFSWYEHWFA